jgi:hypothetical protein
VYRQLQLLNLPAPSDLDPLAIPQAGKERKVSDGSEKINAVDVQLTQLPLFDVATALTIGWHPERLGTGAQVHWASPAEVDARLDADFYVITRRPEQLLDRLRCQLTPIEKWADINSRARRLPTERGYLLFEECVYAQIRDVRDDCWLLGPELPIKAVKELPVRATFEARPGDILLPRVYSSLHRAVIVVNTELPLIVSDAFALLLPHSRNLGLVLLALLHHRVLGEQLWAQSSGTTVRSVAASKVAGLRVPKLNVKEQLTLGSTVEELLTLQKTATFMPESRIWLDGLPSNWHWRAQKKAEAIEQCINRALGAA